MEHLKCHLSTRSLFLAKVAATLKTIPHWHHSVIESSNKPSIFPCCLNLCNRLKKTSSYTDLAHLLFQELFCPLSLYFPHWMMSLIPLRAMMGLTQGWNENTYTFVVQKVVSVLAIAKRLRAFYKRQQLQWHIKGGGNLYFYVIYMLNVYQRDKGRQAH